MKRIYLSGPMTGLPDLNFPAFHQAASTLRARGHQVENPAEINPDGSLPWDACMRADIKALCDCDMLVLLPGWEKSSGAHLELHIAHRIGLQIDHMERLTASVNRTCSYPDCNCPLDAPNDPNWCARGLPHENALREGVKNG